MRPIRIAIQPLLDLFDRFRALTMPEMKAALGTGADLTVFRKLGSLSYQTSYSHRGGFYTLKSIPRFDAQGLWCCRGAWFSRQGTLLDTAVALVEAAPGGYPARQLQVALCLFQRARPTISLHRSAEKALLSLPTSYH